MQLSKEEVMRFNYTHNFALMGAYCDVCKEETNHFFSLVSNNKAFTKSKRIKCCDVCNTYSEAPIDAS